MSQGRKLYFSYEEIKDIFKNDAKEGRFKPWGTMGSHHMLIEPTGDKFKVKGNHEGEVVVCPGDTVGYHLGKVWRVPRPDEYRDPIRRLLAEKKISQSVLKYSDDGVYIVHWHDYFLSPSNADSSRGFESYVMGKHEITTEKIMDVDHITITGGDVVLTKRIGDETKTVSRRRRFIHSIYVRSWADKEEILKWLSELL